MRVTSSTGRWRLPRAGMHSVGGREQARVRLRGHVASEQQPLDVRISARGGQTVAMGASGRCRREEVGRKLDHQPISHESGQHLAIELRLRPVPIRQPNRPIATQCEIRSSHHALEFEQVGAVPRREACGAVGAVLWQIRPGQRR